MSAQFKEDYRDCGWHNFEENLNQPRHCWYPFKEGFSNQLVSTAIREAAQHSKERLRILDPFAGSGTTPLTAALSGQDAVSLEVNPFCAFTSKVKCLPGNWGGQRFRELASKIVNRSRLGGVQSPLESESTFAEGHGKEKWLFNSEVLRGFQSTWDTICEIAEGYEAPLKLAAIRAAMNCCNAKKDGKCLRYTKDWRAQKYSAEHFYQNFSSIVFRMLRDVGIAPIKFKDKPKVIRADARVALEGLDKKSCDLLVTSPPYLNSFDYSDVYRPELFLGQFVKSNAELRRIRLETVRSHVQVDWGGDIAVDNPLVKVAVAKLKNKQDLWNRKIPVMVEAYFHDMRRVLMQAARILRKGAEAWIVVSTSAYKGVHIPVDLILADLGCAEGFSLSGIYVLRALRAAGQQQASFGEKGLPLRESLIKFKR